MAGLIFAYACSVNPGLGRLPDAGYLTAMQSINRAILNPVFLSVFMGAVILLPIGTYRVYTSPASLSFYLLLAASILYIVGVFGVTMAGNVPLNDKLDAFNLSAATPEALARMRADFEGPWNAWNMVRTIAAILAFLLAALAFRPPQLPPQHPGTVTVVMRGMRFYPKVLEIPAGSTVLWVNESNNRHNVVLDDGSFQSPLVKKGDTIRQVFAKPGVYPYYCQPHKWMGMKGTVVVK